MVFVEGDLLAERLAFFHPHLRRRKPVIVPPPLDVVRFRPSAERREAVRRELGISSRTPVILGVGRLDPNKNYITLIRALASLDRKDAVLLIAGAGSEDLNLRQAANHANVSARVRFLGIREDVESLYAAADIFAHPSVLESYGYVVIEAMSTGLPCIVSNGKAVGVNRELTHGKNVLLADAHDPRQWASSISLLLREPDTAAQMGARARLFCEQRSDWMAYCRTVLRTVGVEPHA